ncbi:alanine and glycine-rich protein-like [Halyomorpha halys]|uniref:alanine and glycine-rich protein-like n=1 Tax=Halyomorpha halys TaxID=286706 RepID=UPI0034D1A727
MPDVGRWTLVGTKEEEAGFYGFFKIPESSIRFLEGRGFLMNYNFRKAFVKVHTRRRPPPREERGAGEPMDVESAASTSRSGVGRMVAHRAGAGESGRRTMGGSGVQTVSESGGLITSGSGGLAAGGSGGRAVVRPRELAVESDPGGLAAGGASAAGAGGPAASRAAAEAGTGGGGVSLSPAGGARRQLRIKEEDEGFIPFNKKKSDSYDGKT